MQSLRNPFVFCQPDTSFTYWYYDSLRRNNKIIFSPKAGAAGSKKLYTVLGYKDVTLTTSEGKSKKATTGLVSEYTNKSCLLLNTQ